MASVSFDIPFRSKLEWPGVTTACKDISFIVYANSCNFERAIHVLVLGVKLHGPCNDSLNKSTLSLHVLLKASLAK